MSDWFHELPVPWMALLVFGFTYLVEDAINGLAELHKSVATQIRDLEAASRDVAQKADQTVSGAFERIERKLDEVLPRRGRDEVVELPAMPLRTVN
jgi:hypothetical protein